VGAIVLAAMAAGAGVGARAAAGLEQGSSVTVEGCLMREADVPGRQPPEEERSAVISANNYVLTATKMVTGTAPDGAPGPLLYKVQKLNKGDLRKLVNKRVQIDGTFDKVERAKNEVLFRISLVELQGTAIKEVPGTCAAK
jgi:hypothetical protein